MHIAYYYEEEWEKDYVAKHLPGVTIEFHDGRLPPSHPKTEAEVLSVFVDSHIAEADLDLFPRLKLIATRSTGYDHIDVATALRRGIKIANVPSYGVHTVAEFAMALLLALSRNIIPAHARLAHEHRYAQEGLTGFDLAGKTIGIVGTGQIGAHVAQMAAGFGMKLLGHDAHPKAELSQKYGLKYVELPELLQGSDVISLHVPATVETNHLFGREAFAQMKHGSYLINTARGSVVETGALIEALDRGILAGAGLDVLEDESASLETLALASRPNVILTPHVAFDTAEAKQRILATTIENILAFMKGSPQNLVEK